MGLTKTELFSTAQNELAQVAKALAHPARIAILQQLLETNSCVNAQLVRDLGLAQATISQHLSELKRAGIIQGNIEGKSMSYCIEPIRWNEIKGYFSALFESYKDCIDDCC